jgi:hypothetical protein
MQKGNFIFHPLDLIFPIGIGILISLLCIWGIITTTILSAKVVMTITTIIFIAGIPLWYIARGRAKKEDYTTEHGIKVILGEKNRPSKEEIELWTKDTISFWSNKGFSFLGATLMIPESKMRIVLSSLWIIFVDQEQISFAGKWVRGYVDGNTIVITNMYIESLVKHELSHPILEILLPPDAWGNNHHEIFAQLNLGA